MTDLLIGTAIGLTLALLPVAVTVVRHARERRRISRAAIREHDRMVAAQRDMDKLNGWLASTTATATAVVSEKDRR